MTIFDVLSLLGGLALFLFGMNIMGQALEEVAGPRLKSILESMTGNPFKGLILGLGVTAVIQSSSATTIMVVGFVNSGIMKFQQAIGVIMGANIGTTVTAWLISLVGIEGDNLFLKLLKPSSFMPILAMIGIFFVMSSRFSGKKDVGRAFLGFAVLMTGMETMSQAVTPLADSQAFMNLFILFQNPLFGVLAGAVLTAIIQSSSASVGILQALSATGGVTFGSAIPIIMGQNIGTCVTAMMSSIGANKHARRTALVHLYFNVIGTLVYLVGFTMANWIFDFSFINLPINVFWIAIIHSLFNFGCVALLFPFREKIGKLAVKSVPDKGENRGTVLLDPRLFSTPSVAVERSRQVMCEMAELARTNVIKTVEMLWEDHLDQFKEIKERENLIDTYEDGMRSYLVDLSDYNLSSQDSHDVYQWLHGITDFERIGDHSMNIAKHIVAIREKKQEFSEDAKAEIKVLSDAVVEIVNKTVDAYIEDDHTKAYEIDALEQVIDDLDDHMKDSHILRLREGRCSIESGMIYDEIMTDMERISDHCSNLSICQLSSKDETIDMHKYRKRIKEEAFEEFQSLYNAYRNKYKLPTA